LSNSPKVQISQKEKKIVQKVPKKDFWELKKNVLPEFLERLIFYLILD
jgi:hypothetical protein